MKPKPKHVKTVCEVCGLDWNRHGKTPTIEKCIQLLKQDLAGEKIRTAPIQPSLPYVPYPAYPPVNPYRPRPWPYSYPQPTWTSPNTSGTANTISGPISPNPGTAKFL